MRRCNENPVYYSETNGYRLCESCYQDGLMNGEDMGGMVHDPGFDSGIVGPERCDKPIETAAEFWARWGRAYPKEAGKHRQSR